MPTIQLTLPNPINVSLQAKAIDVASSASSVSLDAGAWDVIYFARIASNEEQTGEILRLGNCVNITMDKTTYTIDVDVDEDVQTPDVGDYIFFGKDNKIGTAGVVGYFTEVEMRNDSISGAELFAVSSEVTQSSK